MQKTWAIPENVGPELGLAQVLKKYKVAKSQVAVDKPPPANALGKALTDTLEPRKEEQELQYTIAS